MTMTNRTKQSIPTPENPTPFFADSSVHPSEDDDDGGGNTEKGTKRRKRRGENEENLTTKGWD